MTEKKPLSSAQTLFESLHLSEFAFDKVPPHRWEVILDVVVKSDQHTWCFQRFNVKLREPCSIIEAQNLALTYLFEQVLYPVTEVLAVRCERMGEALEPKP